jgi:hypothetical protein
MSANDPKRTFIAPLKPWGLYRWQFSFAKFIVHPNNIPLKARHLSNHAIDLWERGRKSTLQRD